MDTAELLLVVSRDMEENWLSVVEMMGWNNTQLWLPVSPQLVGRSQNRSGRTSFAGIFEQGLPKRCSLFYDLFTRLLIPRRNLVSWDETVFF